MAKVKFERLYLLSTTERRALEVPLSGTRVVVQGGNGFGKSAIIKSLYQSLGATPLKIDSRWTSANVSSCLLFEMDGRRFASVRSLGLHALFDMTSNTLLFSGRRLVKDWGPPLAEFFGFKLEMSDKAGDVVVPPPAYMFAPFYVDQDGGWSKPWSSFADFYLPQSTATLTDYHSGIKPNEYYAAKASSNRARIELSGIEAGITTLRDSIEQIRNVDAPQAPTLDLAIFEEEVADLVQENGELLARQGRHRRRVSELHEEMHLVRAERSLLQGALAEMRGEFEQASSIRGDIECPTCGVIYDNGLADRFGLIQDEEVVADAIGAAEARLVELQDQESKSRTDLQSVETGLARIKQILSIQRAAVSLNDVIVAAGKTEAAKMLRTALDEKALSARDVSARMDAFRATMAKFTDQKRSKEIKNKFFALLTEFTRALDVALDESANQTLASIKVARGSEGPRALLAYYYAFLHVSAQYSDGVRFPIVIDAPNQQGQDTAHLPQMLKFILERAPKDSQVIVATEEVGGMDLTGIDVRSYGERKRQVLRDAEYDSVVQVMKPFNDAILAATAGP